MGPLKGGWQNMQLKLMRTCIVLLLKVNICKQYLPLRRRAAVHATLRNINDCALYFLVSAVS